MINNMKKRLLLCLIALAVPLHSTTSAKTTIKASSPKLKNKLSYSYNESSENKTVSVNWEEENTNNQRKISLISENETEIILGNNNTEQWLYKNNDSNNEISIGIKDDLATIKQIKDGKTSTKTMPLNGTPFKYPPSFFMSDFIASDKQKLFFWVANKTDGNLRQMIFTKLGTETITIQNKDIMCTKIEMKPPGLAGMVWKALYWFDSKTGEFIQYSGKKGPPGTPDFLIQKKY